MEEVVESNVEEVENESTENEVMEDQQEGSSSESSGVSGETSEESARAEITEAIEDGATEEEVKELVKKLSVKVNGKEREYEIDVNNEDKLRELIQKGLAGSEMMQSAKEKEKADQEMMDFWKKNPETFLKESGMDPVEFAEMVIQNQIQEMQKTPEQVKQEEMEKELNELREKIKKEEDSKREKDLEAARIQTENDVRSEIEQALDATKTLPKNPFVTRRVAEVWHSALAEGKEVSAIDVIPAVKNEIQANMQDLLKSVPEEFLEEWLGKQMMDKMRVNRLSKMPKEIKNTTNIKPTGKKIESKAKSKINLQDWLAGKTKLS